MNIFIKKPLKSFLNSIRPLVERLADFYNIPIRKGFMVYGQNKLILEDEETSRRRFISKSAYFNTRSGNISIGKNTLISENVMVITGKHLDVAEAIEQKVPLYSVPLKGRDIFIGRNCFIASGAIILGNVKIGDYSVVGAGAVVTKDVPERVFVAGVPAKIIKNLTVSEIKNENID